MEVIGCINVNAAYYHGMKMLLAEGEEQASRAGNVIVAPFPVTTVYYKPMQRVLFDERRDANPFFHLMEALWMLNGENDARWLDLFVKDFSSRFAESDGRQHGAYGYRWCQHFGGDQLEVAVRKLRKNSLDRQVVIQMWDPGCDNNGQYKDIPCNLVVLPRVLGKKLSITVFCRSNDAIYGCYGANAVHFSVLQEYLAAKLGLDMGSYSQVSNNFHAYENVLSKVWPPTNEHMAYKRGDVEVTPIVTDADNFDSDLACFMRWTRNPFPLNRVTYNNRFFPNVAVPMFASAGAWRAGNKALALRVLDDMPNKRGDWYLACKAWMIRRLEKQK